MDAVAFSGTLLSPQRDLDEILEIRAQKHQQLRARKNVTSCRSPTRELDTRQIKSKLKEKRYLEFQRRRSESNKRSGFKSTQLHSRRMNAPEANNMKSEHFTGKLQTLYTNIQSDPAARELIETDWAPDSSETTASIHLDEKTLLSHRQGQGMEVSTTSTELIQRSDQRSQTSSTINNKAAEMRFIETEQIHTSATQTPVIIQKKVLGPDSDQTESEFVTIKEVDMQRLADYLQEALWREDALKRKLAALQESISGLLGSSDVVWTSRCTEDLLRSQIKTLEAQLHVCLQSIPEDAAKKLLVTMEKERLVYEEQAMVALQKATEDKAEALSKAETLQEELLSAKEEALRWTNLYEELKVKNAQNKQSQRLSLEGMEQLHHQVELSKATEKELRDKLSALRQENQDLQFNILLLEENNQALRDEIEQLRDDGDDGENLMLQEFLLSNKSELNLTERRDAEVEEKLHHTQEMLQLKQSECEELQTELKVMEQECQSSQARLSQCRDELRLLSQSCRTRTPCFPWWKVCVFLLFLSVLGVAMLWMCHPPFRELMEDLYSDIETRIEGYLVELASPQHPGCCRPI